MNTQRLHTKTLNKALTIKREMRSPTKIMDGQQYDENEICKKFLSCVVDEGCEMIMNKEAKENMHLPMWLMAHYNHVVKLYSMDEKEKGGSLENDRLLNYLEASSQLFEEIETHLDRSSAIAIYRKAKNKMLSQYNDPSSHHLIYLLASNHFQNDSKQNKPNS